MHAYIHFLTGVHKGIDFKLMDVEFCTKENLLQESNNKSWQILLITPNGKKISKIRLDKEQFSIGLQEKWQASKTTTS